ncbi:MAG: DUF1573 domain-containing protein [Bacteroidales bacterium]|nr:DUF1573 domain-containing protein [Bacteroidales bacterium]
MKNFILILLVLQVSLAFSQETNERGPKIEFISEVYDYGTIVAGSGHDGIADFYFVNIGEEPLVLTNVRAGCGCTSPYWHAEPVLPGDTAKVVLKYTTLQHPHTINKTAVVQSNAINKPTVVLRITGIVEPQPTEMMPEKNIDREFSPIAR